MVLRWGLGDFPGAEEAWRRKPGAPTDDAQRLAFAEVAAEGGFAEAETLAEELRQRRPIEAAAVDARRLWRLGRWQDAASRLTAAFEAYRSDPWPHPAVMERALGLASSLARDAGDPRLTAQLWRALAEPFAVRLLDDARRLMLVALAAGLAGGPCNDEMRLALAALEPHVPWSRQILGARAQCYAAWDHPLRERARRQFGEYLAAEPLGLAIPDKVEASDPSVTSP